MTKRKWYVLFTKQNVSLWHYKTYHLHLIQMHLKNWRSFTERCEHAGKYSQTTEQGMCERDQWFPIFSYLPTYARRFIFVSPTSDPHFFCLRNKPLRWWCHKGAQRMEAPPYVTCKRCNMLEIWRGRLYPERRRAGTQGRIQPVTSGGAVSVIFGRQVS